MQGIRDQYDKRGDNPQCHNQELNHVRVGFFFQLILHKMTEYNPSYCSNLLLSFARRAVVPAKVCGPLGELISKWVATTLPLMDIIGQTLTRSLVEFSSREFTGFHFTLVGSSRALVGGLQVVCSNGCGEQIASGSNAAQVDGKPARKYRFSCTKCGFIAKAKIRDGEVPECYRDVIIKVPGVEYTWTQFPIPVRPLEWRARGPSANSPAGVFNSAEEPPVIIMEEVSPAPLIVPPPPTLTSTSLPLGRTREGQTKVGRTQPISTLASGSLHRASLVSVWEKRGAGRGGGTSAKRVQDDPSFEGGSSNSVKKRKKSKNCKHLIPSGGHFA